MTDNTALTHLAAAHAAAKESARRARVQLEDTAADAHPDAGSRTPRLGVHHEELAREAGVTTAAIREMKNRARRAREAAGRPVRRRPQSDAQHDLLPHARAYRTAQAAEEKALRALYAEIVRQMPERVPGGRVSGEARAEVSRISRESGVTASNLRHIQDREQERAAAEAVRRR